MKVSIPSIPQLQIGLLVQKHCYLLINNVFATSLKMRFVRNRVSDTDLFEVSCLVDIVVGISFYFICFVLHLCSVWKKLN